MTRRAVAGLLALAACTAVVSADFQDEDFVDTPSPNEPIEKPECDPDVPVTIRYSMTSARLYLESGDGETRGGCVTLDQIWEARAGKAPLYAVDPETGDKSDSITGTWLLEESLYVTDGITLKVGGWPSSTVPFMSLLLIGVEGQGAAKCVDICCTSALVLTEVARRKL